MNTRHVPTNNPREIWGWIMYDWANSAFSTTVVSGFLGPYLAAITQAAAVNGFVSVLGVPVKFDSFYPYCVSLSVLLQVFLLPVLGAIADFSHLRKRMLMFFALLGSIATILLFFVSTEVFWLGGLLFIVANLAFGASVVFYNAYLPDIATPDQRDAVSARGFALGYAGGGLLLALNLVLFTAGGAIGVDSALAARISLASAGFWWLGFSFITFRAIQPRHAVRQLPAGDTYLSIGLKQLANTVRQVAHFPETVRYLVAYLLFNDGIQTVIVVATLFAAGELKMTTTELILVLLMIQAVAFVGAYAVSYVAQRAGAMRVLIGTLVIWSVVVVYAWIALTTKAEFWVLGAVIALVLGGSQAIARSLFAQMIPHGREAEFFSFYEISDKGTSWIGPLLFGLANQVFGSMRYGILSLIVLFIGGLAVLLTVNVARAIKEADTAHLIEAV